MDSLVNLREYVEALKTLRDITVIFKEPAVVDRPKKKCKKLNRTPKLTTERLKKKEWIFEYVWRENENPNIETNTPVTTPGQLLKQAREEAELTLLTYQALRGTNSILEFLEQMTLIIFFSLM